MEIFHAKNWSTLMANYSYGPQWSSGISMDTIRLDPPLMKSSEKPCAKLRENLLFAILHSGFAK